MAWCFSWLLQQITKQADFAVTLFLNSQYLKYFVWPSVLCCTALPSRAPRCHLVRHSSKIVLLLIYPLKLFKFDQRRSSFRFEPIRDEKKWNCCLIWINELSKRHLYKKKRKIGRHKWLDSSLDLYMSHDYQSQRELTAMFTSLVALFVISRWIFVGNGFKSLCFHDN